MPTQVVTVSNRVPKEPYYRLDMFLTSLGRFGISPTVLGMNEPWHGLMTKPNHFRKWLRDNKSDEHVILCDSWDVVFSDHPDFIGEKSRSLFGNNVVFNAEKACWPRSDLSDSFPETGTPWRFLNSGFICGPASEILTMIESMNIDSIGVDRVEGGKRIEPNDQGEFQALFGKQPVPMIVDGGCMVSQTLSACSIDEFDLSGERIMNAITGTTPSVFHFNGDSKNKLMPAFIAKLKL